jgi:hypothetical protein
MAEVCVCGRRAYFCIGRNRVGFYVGKEAISVSREVQVRTVLAEENPISMCREAKSRSVRVEEGPISV